MKAHDQKPEKNAHLDSIRLQLSKADNEHRALLFALFNDYPHDIGPVIKILFAEASRATLEKVESLLSANPETEGVK